MKGSMVTLHNEKYWRGKDPCQDEFKAGSKYKVVETYVFTDQDKYLSYYEDWAAVLLSNEKGYHCWFPLNTISTVGGIFDMPKRKIPSNKKRLMR